MLVLQQFRSSEEVGVYFAVVKTLALVSFIHYAMAATTAHRFAEYHALGDKDAALSLCRARDPVDVLAVARRHHPAAGAGQAAVVAVRPAIHWSGYDIMFIAAIGLLVRAAIGPVERLLNMLGHQHICAHGLCALPFVMNLVLCLAAGAALWRPRRGGSNVDRTGSFETVLLFWIVRRQPRPARAGVREAGALKLTEAVGTGSPACY